MTRISEDLGVERLCNRCQEWWPFDEEFYYMRDGRIYSSLRYCRACVLEYYQDRRGRGLSS